MGVIIIWTGNRVVYGHAVYTSKIHATERLFFGGAFMHFYMYI